MKREKPKAEVRGPSGKIDPSAADAFMRTGELPPKHTGGAQPGDDAREVSEHTATVHHTPGTHLSGVRDTPETHPASVSHTPETRGNTTPQSVRAKRAPAGTRATVERRYGGPVRRTNVHFREETFNALRGYCAAKGLEISATIDRFVDEGLRHRAGMARRSKR